MPNLKLKRHHAVYLRVSTDKQKHDSQEEELRAWADAQSEEVVFYRDVISGKSKPDDRPGWSKLNAAIRQRRVISVVVWRLDRLGRHTSSLSKLFDDLIDRKIGLVSLRDGIDLSTPAGRMIANVLASIAQFEREVISERVRAGVRASIAKGTKWNGSKAGVPKVVTDEQRQTIVALFEQGMPKAAIARTLKLSRPTIDRWLNYEADPIG